MHQLAEYTDRIKALLADGSDSALTYAALEARLAIERVCYERLKISHDYISADDLRTWKPQYVVQTLMEMVDPQIAGEWTLSIGSEPGDNPKEYVPVGTQKGFDPKKLSELWQAMSSFLHSRVPKSRDAAIPHYADVEKIRPKLVEVLQELERIGQGTAIGAMVFEQVSFECRCGQMNKRAQNGLSHGATLNCIREGCKEQYVVEKKDGDFYFDRKTITATCHKCRHEAHFGYREVTELPRGRHGRFDCSECGAQNAVEWKLMQLDHKKEA
jgi:hypothetical protein